MDYCEGPRWSLNSCQKRRAANQRKKFLNKHGKVLYRRLTGLR